MRLPGGAYEGNCDDRALAAWAAEFSRWARGGLDVYCHFDNDQAAYAARNALRLREMSAAQRAV